MNSIPLTPLDPNQPMNVAGDQPQTAGAWAQGQIDNFHNDRTNPVFVSFAEAIRIGLVTDDAAGWLAFRGTPAVESAARVSLGLDTPPVAEVPDLAPAAPASHVAIAEVHSKWAAVKAILHAGVDSVAGHELIAKFEAFLFSL